MKVLLVRNDGIGDALVCAPLLAALRDGGHQVGALLGSVNRGIFARDALAHVHAVERIPWPAHGSTAASRTRALAEVKAVGYHVALVASEEMDAYAFARDANIARRVGFVNGWEKPLKTLQIKRLLTETIVRSASAKGAREHEVETIFALGAGLHAETAPTRDPARLRPLILDQPVNPQHHVALQVSAKNESAGLDRETYTALARALSQSRLEVLLLGDEPALLNAIARDSGVMSDGMLDMESWKARIAASRALITPDSGAAHVAGMIGLPTIDCFPGGPGATENIRRWSPWAAPHRSLVLATAPPEFMAGALVGELLDLLYGARR